MKPFRFFIHAGNKPGPSIRLQEVLDDILDYVFKTPGFINDCEKIIIFTNDDSVKIPVHEKIQNHRVHEDWGVDSLEIVHDFCINNPNYNVLVGHCKGTIKGDNYNYDMQDDWRKLMCYFSITKYVECMKILEDHETCGVEYEVKPKNHYSGGFFWATAEYVKILPPVKSVPHNTIGGRYDLEMWIGLYAKNPHSMHQSGVQHYRQRYPKELYEDK